MYDSGTFDAVLNLWGKRWEHIPNEDLKSNTGTGFA